MYVCIHICGCFFKLRGPSEGSHRAPFKGFGVDIEQVWKLILIRTLLDGCFLKLGAFSFIVRALVFGVYMRAPEC